MSGWLDPSMLAQAEIVARVAFAMLLGAVLGWDLERLGKPAGLRTMLTMVGRLEARVWRARRREEDR